MKIRQYSLLRDLLSHEDYITADELASKYSVSSKTIYKDIEIINCFIEQFKIKINRTPRKGIRLLINEKDKRKLQTIISDELQRNNVFPELDRIELLVKHFIKSDYLDVLDFSLDNFISETSVRRDLLKLERMINSYRLSLDRNQGEVQLSGEESDKRFFYRQFIMNDFSNHLEKNGILFKFFDDKIVKSVKKLITIWEKDHGLKIDNNAHDFLLVDLLITYYRFINHYALDDLTVKRDFEMETYQLFVLSGELLASILEVELPKISEDEIIQLGTTILALGFNIKGPDNTDDEIEMVDQLINEVSDLINIDLMKDSHLQAMLLAHIKPMIYRLKTGINTTNQITESIKLQYGILFNFVWIASKNISRLYDVVLTDSEVALLTVHFELAIEKIIQPITIYVICSHRIAISELIISQLRKIVSDFDQLVATDIKDLSNINIKENDILISSINIDDFGYPYILVNNIISPTQLIEIQKLYLNNVQGNKKLSSHLSSSTHHARMLIAKLIENSIYLDKNFKTKEKCLEYIISKSKKSNLSGIDYSKSILERELLGNTSIYTGMALPHASPETVMSSEMVVLTLNKPIKWGVNTVKVIILISIESGDLKIYREALATIYSKIDSEKFIDDLWMSKDKEELLQKLLT